MTFVESYGPWAVIASASEGVGASFAAAVARAGVNVVLLARRQGDFRHTALDHGADIAGGVGHLQSDPDPDPAFA